MIKTKQGSSSFILIIIFALVALSVAGYWHWRTPKITDLINPIHNALIPPSPTSTKPVACTQEAKLCPDGSYVSRVAPSCEFAACPSLPPPSTINNRQDRKDEQDTTTFKEYNNPTIGISFKYPHDWTTQSLFENPVTHGDSGSSFLLSLRPPTQNTKSIQVSHTLLDYDNKPIDEQLRAINCSPDEDLSQRSYCVQIKNHNGVRYIKSRIYLDYYDTYEFLAWIPTGKYIIVIGIETAYPEKDIQTLQIIDAILASINLV